MFSRSILFLTRKGFELLRNDAVLTRHPHLLTTDLDRRLRVSDLTLRHELEVMDVKTAVKVAIERTHGPIAHDCL